MRPCNVFMFSGQGSQYYQMGKVLFDQGGMFARHMRRLDGMVRDLGGFNVLPELYGDRSKAVPFDDLRLSHPAIFMVEFALAQCVIDSGIEPDMTLGVSLGSVAAAVVAGSLGVEDALRWVLRHAGWIVENSEPGGMLGILSPPELHQVGPLRHGSVIAAWNGPSHWVLSARDPELPGIEAFLRSSDVAFSRLPVRYPFHSPWLVKSAHCRVARVPSPPVAAARLPIVCCGAGGVVDVLDADHLWNATVLPIRFEQTLRHLEAREPACRFIDIGPSSTLATLVRALLPAGSPSTVHGILSPYGRELQSLGALAAAVPDSERVHQ